MSDHTTLVLGRDSVGVVAESDGMRYYLTDCCGASAKGMENYTGCRACYAEIDDALGGIPDKSMALVEGRWDFVDRPLVLVDVYGDGLDYDAWVATIPGLADRQAAQRAEREASRARFASSLAGRS